MERDTEKGIQKEKRSGQSLEELRPVFLSNQDFAPVPLKVYGVTSLDRGGLRTFLASNLALALSQQGKKVWVSDEESSPCTIRSLLGLPELFDDSFSTSHRFFVPGPQNLTFVSGQTRILSHIIYRLRESLASVPTKKFPDAVLTTFPSPFPRSHEGIIRSLDKLFLLIPVQKRMVMDVYKTIKTALTLNPKLQISAICYQTNSPEEAVVIYLKMDGLSRKFLRTGLEFGGYLPNDPMVTESIANKMPLVRHFPSSPLAQMISSLVEEPGLQPDALTAAVSPPETVPPSEAEFPPPTQKTA